MPTVLVTGATGFIGGHLVEALVRRGDRVRCLVRRSSSLEVLNQLDVERITCDLSEPQDLDKLLTGVDVVFHLAGLTRALRPEEMMRVNAEGTQYLTRAMAAAKVPPVHVLISSISAAGPVPRGLVRSEFDPPNPISNYGRSKRAGEVAAESMARAVPTTIVRPGIVFGERNRQMLPIFRMIKSLRLHPVPGIIGSPLSLIHVRDLVEILLRAADRGARLTPDATDESERQRGYYFACDGEYPDYAQLGRLIGSAMDRSSTLTLPVPYPLPFLLAGANELVGRALGRSDEFNIDKIREARASSWACSPEAVRRDLDFEPPLPLIDRLRQTVKWYRQNHWL